MRTGLALLLALAGCASLETREVPRLATARVTSDFQSYSLRRIGLLPIPVSQDVGPTDESLESVFQAELVDATGLEVVVIDPQDLLEVDALEPFRRGAYPAATLLELRRRFRLDAVGIGTVTTRRLVPPQRLGLQFDLVSCETGATLWTSSVLLDAADRETRDALEVWAARHTEVDGGAELILLSPRRFARFATWQVMQLL